MDMKIKGLRLVRKRPFTVGQRGKYGKTVSISSFIPLEAGEMVMQYATERGDVVVLKRQRVVTL
jgi:hypothetical protein